MERSGHYNLHVSRASRSRLKAHDPNLSMRSGTYQIHKPIPRSLKQETVYIPVNSVLAVNPQISTPRENVGANRTHGTELKPRNRSLSPQVLVRPYVVYDPMPSLSPRSPVTRNGITQITAMSNGTTSPKLMEETVKENQFFTKSRSISPQDVSHQEEVPKSLQLFQNGDPIKTSRFENGNKPAQNGIAENHTTSKPMSPQFKNNGVRHNSRSIYYQQKHGRSKTPTDPARKSAPVTRTMSLNIGTKTSKSYISLSKPRSKSPKREHSMSIKKPPNKILDTSISSSKSQFDDSIVTPRSLNDTWTEKFTLDTSIASQSSFHSNMYDVYKELCQQRGVLFEDPDFGAVDESLFKTYVPDVGKIHWLRPKEIAVNPTFMENGSMKFNIQQGKLGTSWMVGAFSCLMQTPNLLKQCVPEGQGFGNGYVGLFKFRFWRYGQWIDVIIDDKLPVLNGELICLHCQNSTDFWVALFEKAYAKMYGSYENIRGGRLGWSLQDITGGVMQIYPLADAPATLQSTLSHCMSRSSLMGACIVNQTGMTSGQKHQLQNGLMVGHVYSITGYAKLPLSGGNIVLLRLRNCWGKADWKGAWCEGSDRWDILTEEDKIKIRKIRMKEGEFWISYIDFVTNFTLLEVCYLLPESWQQEPNIQYRHPWSSAQGFRQWRRGYNAGGGPNSPLTSCNCQFYLELSKPSGVVVSLMQQYKCNTNFTTVPCACLVYSTNSGLQGRLGYTDLNQTHLVASSVFRDGRENTSFFELSAGFYIILPVTHKTGMEGKFLLRILTEGGSKVRELDDKDLVVPINRAKKKPNRMHDGARLYNFRRKFLYAINQNEELDPLGLQHILDHKHGEVYKLWCCQSEEEALQFKPLKLSLETCKSAIAIVDHGVKGKLHFEEFNTLLSLLMYWQEIFHKMSRGCLTMETYSLRTALRMTGFMVSNKTLEALVIRFANKETMGLESFVNALVKLSVAHRAIAKERYRLSKQDDEKEATLFLQELLRAAIYS